MSKANTIRKKALEHARRQDWEAAIREYRRLAEVDQSNPNLYNELGDIYLKTGNKGEAYDAFIQAVDSYARVSLFNNAVAVCKKVLRLIPARYQVVAKLGCIRKQQGLAREAESYCLQYLDALDKDSNVDAAILAQTAEQVLESMADCAVVLDRLAAALTANGLDTEGGHALAALYALYNSEGNSQARDQVRERLDAAGMGHMIQSEEKAPVEKAPVKEGPVMTEDNIWTDSLSDGERISVDSQEQSNNGGAVTMGSGESGSNDFDNNVVNLPDPNGDETEADDAPQPPTDVDLDDAVDAAAPDPNKVHVSAIIDDVDLGGSESDESDYRSHYDLGMAYLEMNLFDEAIREYQLASRSPEFQVKSLEMVGLCFLKQNKPQLAIKQLTKGLSQIDDT
ncbi:MAG: tetratricopeptide repeat protein, partial [Candidatus Latescibacterota bacterium]